MISWEYHIAYTSTALETLGRQGWELVAVVPVPGSDSPALYLKRRRASFRDRVTEEQKQRYYATRSGRQEEDPET